MFVMSSSTNHQRVTSYWLSRWLRALWLRVLAILWPVPDRFHFFYDFVAAKRFDLMVSRPCLRGTRAHKPPNSNWRQNRDVTRQIQIEFFRYHLKVG
jgi:hypothetical protein